nr:hypothetical protein [uncultured Pseudomonas sp.]
MANSAKIKRCPQGKNPDDLRYAPQIGDHIVDPVAGRQKITGKTWNFDDPNADFIEFDLEPASKST